MNLAQPILKQEAVRHAVQLARDGNVTALDNWLLTGGDPNLHDAEGWTPLLAAAVRGQAAAVDYLLNTPIFPADPDLRHAVSGGLAIHFAGHSGNVAVAEKILAVRPNHLEEAWLVNGHTLLLQAAFYGHLALARFALQRGANTAATTLRGLGAIELAQQFQNQPMIDLLQPYNSPRESKRAYLQTLLQIITPITPPDQRVGQARADELVATIERGLAETTHNPSAIERTLVVIRDLVENQHADVNRLGGGLQQPALIVAVTGNNGSPSNPNLAELRLRVSEYLLEHGADPKIREVHPMGVGPIIRAAVFNHLDVLKLMARYMQPSEVAAELNVQPVVNGLTALHDSVLRASMAGADRIEGYLAQIRWAVANGARYDIEDFSGRTQRSIAEQVVDQARRLEILQALGIPN